MKIMCRNWEESGTNGRGGEKSVREGIHEKVGGGIDCFEGDLGFREGIHKNLISRIDTNIVENKQIRGDFTF